MKVGARTSRSSKATTLLLCVALLASFWNGACALACTLAPMAANVASSHADMASHPQTDASAMVMEGNHDCCPRATTATRMTALQPPVCPAPQAVAWMTVEDAPLRAANIYPADQPQPDFFGVAAQPSLPGITDRRWPPGSSRSNWMSPTGFTPTVTQILV